MTPTLTILPGDALAVLRTLPDESVQCCVTSPPYFSLRDYGVEGQMGLEASPEIYIAKMVEVFREVRRVLRHDSTCWINLGDSYNAYNHNRGPAAGANKNSHEVLPAADRGLTCDSLKPKDLLGIPWRLALALQSDGWWLRQDIIWAKRAPMPESVTDRCCKAHEYLFLLSKSARYFFDSEAIKEPCTEPDDGRERVYGGKNKGAALRLEGIRVAGNTVIGNGTMRTKRSVWTIGPSPYPEAHFATFPPDLIKPCILAGTSARGCCPKCGAPWQRVVEKVKGRPASFNGSDFRNGKKALSASALAAVGQGERTAETTTTGWVPTCDCYLCDDDIPSPVPCTVLDPFGGSGTTGQVSLELGRSAILIELNPAYVALARRRCAVTPGLALA